MPPDKSRYERSQIDWKRLRAYARRVARETSRPKEVRVVTKRGKRPKTMYKQRIFRSPIPYTVMEPYEETEHINTDYWVLERRYLREITIWQNDRLVETEHHEFCLASDGALFKNVWEELEGSGNTTPLRVRESLSDEDVMLFDYWPEVFSRRDGNTIIESNSRWLHTGLELRYHAKGVGLSKALGELLEPREEERRKAREEQQRREREQAEAERRQREAERERQRRQEEDAKRRKRKPARVLILLLMTIGLAVGGYYAITTPTPNFLGSTLAEAAERADRGDFEAFVSSATDSSKPRGTIVGQSPPPDKRIADRKVGLTISGGHGTFAVPDVGGLSTFEACRTLMQRGLNSRQCGTWEVMRRGALKYSANRSGKAVYGTDPPAGTEVQVGTKISLEHLVGKSSICSEEAVENRPDIPDNNVLVQGYETKSFVIYIYSVLGQGTFYYGVAKDGGDYLSLPAEKTDAGYEATNGDYRYIITPEKLTVVIPNGKDAEEKVRSLCL